MKPKIRHKKLLYIIAMCLIILTVYLSYRGIKNHLWAKYQESIQITPEQVIDIYQLSGYDIRNIDSIDGVNSAFTLTKNGLSFDMIVDGIPYIVSIGCADGWQEARRSANYAEKIEEQFGGGMFYPFYFGSVVVYVMPPEDASVTSYYRQLGEELYGVLKEEYQSDH